MAISRDFRGFTRPSCRRTVFWISSVVLIVILSVNLFLYIYWLSEVGRLQFYRRELTFDTNIIKNRCNASYHETGTNHRKSVDLRLFVLTYNRPDSVVRLLHSLNGAKYGNSSVILEVWVDRSVSGDVDQETLAVLKKFVFKHGGYQVCVQAKHAGIIGQWLTPWKAEESSDDEIAVILEDDLTVSPYFYTYLKQVHSKYGHSPKVNGFALQGWSMKHCSGFGCIHGSLSVNFKNTVFLYPTLGTWGFSPNRKNWIMFIKWFEYKYGDAIFNPLVQGHVSLDWYGKFAKEGSVDNFWEVWHIYFTRINSEFTLYPNFEDHKGLTFNWKENGLHYTDKSVVDQTADKQSLLLEWKYEYLKLPDTVVVVNNDGSVLSHFYL